MSSISIINPKVDILRKSAALTTNSNACRSLMELLKSNLGPAGTLKMLVGGGGQIKITKDGNVLLHEMQIQHPTAAMIARASTAQDTITGDGTTSTVLLIGEIMRQAEIYLSEGLHPRVLSNGIELAKAEVLKILDSIRLKCSVNDRETLHCISKTSLGTKLPPKVIDQFTDIVVDAILCVHTPGTKIDLFMIEILHINEGLATNSRFVKGMVLDHGTRHANMPHSLKNCFILSCNISLEYERTEVNSGFFYNTAEKRNLLVENERKFTDDKVKKIIELKRLVCGKNPNTSFVVLNQKGIDPLSLDLLARDGIMALRRVKRRNMERLTLCCGGNAVNSVNDLSVDDLGFAESVYEKVLGDEKWTFVEGVKNPKACTILIRGPNDCTISQIKDALRDGLRAVKNAIEDEYIVPGGGYFEIASYCKLQEYLKFNVTGKQKLGVDVFSKALLIIPKTLAENFGLDTQDCITKLTEEYYKHQNIIGVNSLSVEPINTASQGIFDNYSVKKQMIALVSTLSQQLFLVDEIIKAGKQINPNGKN